MTRILLKVTNESSADLGHLDVTGASGLCYKFTWDKLVGAFVYLPQSNDEISDIFDMLRLPQFPYRFLPVLIEGNVKSATPIFSPPPLVKKELYEKNDMEELVALCADCGFAPDDSGSRRAVLAQLNAYFLGRVHHLAAQEQTPPAQPQRPKKPARAASSQPSTFAE
jgi:hypothetical protein